MHNITPFPYVFADGAQSSRVFVCFCADDGDGKVGLVSHAKVTV